MTADPPKFDEKPAPTDEDEAADEAARRVSIDVRQDAIRERQTDDPERRD
jgi:hypothetical protein